MGIRDIQPHPACATGPHLDIHPHPRPMRTIELHHLIQNLNMSHQMRNIRAQHLLLRHLQMPGRIRVLHHLQQLPTAGIDILIGERGGRIDTIHNPIGLIFPHKSGQRILRQDLLLPLPHHRVQQIRQQLLPNRPICQQFIPPHILILPSHKNIAPTRAHLRPIGRLLGQHRGRRLRTGLINGCNNEMRRSMTQQLTRHRLAHLTGAAENQEISSLNFHRCKSSIGRAIGLNRYITPPS